MQYRMLRRHSTGYPFPFTENLSKQEGMIECFMTKEEVEQATIRQAKPEVPSEQIKEKTIKDEKPGPGWRKNNRGQWVRGVKTT